MARKPAPKKPKGDEEEAPPVSPVEICPEEYHVAQAERIWAYDDTGHKLTVEQQLFCRSYIVDRNPVAAMRRLNFAGDATKLRKMAEQLLSNTEVQGCIETLAKELMDRLTVTAENVNRRLAAVAFFDPRKIAAFDSNGVQLKHSKFWTLDEAWAVAGLKEGKDGVEIKFHDGVRAAEMLGKQLGTIPDTNVEIEAAKTKALAEGVMEKLLEVFDKTVPDDTPALPAPDTLQ